MSVDASPSLPAALPPGIAGRIRIDPDGCWHWTGTVAASGYGLTRVASQTNPIGAHRLLYELLVGAIPPGMQIDHLCRVPNCVNPDHLEPVTPQVNAQRWAAQRHYHTRPATTKSLAFRSDPSDSRHGTANGYTNLRCRCAACTRANADRRQTERR